jgi:glycosyltransferase involved in cell wall biosynthesis
MKIAFVTYPTAALLPPYHGSMGATIYAIASALAGSHEVLVYGLKNVQKGEESGVYEGASYRFFPCSSAEWRLFRARQRLIGIIQFSEPISTSGLLFPSFGRQVAEDLAREQCDVIHVQHCSQYLPVIRALNPNAKIVLHIHSEWFSQSKPALIERRLRCVDYLMTVSDYVTRKTKQDYRSIADRCETIYNGVDFHEFPREKDYAAANRQEIKRILFVGGVFPHKGPHVLLDAFKIVAARYPQVRLDIVGGQGSYPMEECFDLSDKDLVRSVAPLFAENRLALLRSKLGLGPSQPGTYTRFLQAKLAGDLAGKVVFHGFLSRPELVDYYYRADVFVFPPIWNEAFGCTPLEAMAAGTPVVASRSGGIVETMKPGETGFLVEKNDSEALAEAILRLLEDDALREKMGRAARRHALSRFHWNDILSAMCNRYESLCAAQDHVPTA